MVLSAMLENKAMWWHDCRGDLLPPVGGQERPLGRSDVYFQSWRMSGSQAREGTFPDREAGWRQWADWQVCERSPPRWGQEASRGQISQSLLDHSMCNRNHQRLLEKEWCGLWCHVSLFVFASEPGIKRKKLVKRAMLEVLPETVSRPIL